MSADDEQTTCPGMTVDLPELVDSARAGNLAARDRLFGFLRGRLTGLVRRMLAHSGLDADDALQDVLLKILIALPTFDTGRGVKFTTWSHVIAANHCRQLRRQQRTRRAIVTREPDLEHLAEERAHEGALDRLAFAELRARLREAFDRLASGQREILRMRVERELSYDAIGRQLGVSSGTVKSRLNRARTLLRALLVGFDLDDARVAS